MSKKKIIIIVGVLIAIGAYFIIQNLVWQVDNNTVNRTYTDLENLRPRWVSKRQSAQQDTAKAYQIFHDFSFINTIDESGIKFEHFANPDGTKTYKPVHYDHGNGLAVADVDNDGLIDIYFVSQVGKGGLWRNLGNGQFEDITNKAGLDITDTKSCVSASFADIDNDGDADLYISVIREGNFLFENQGDGTYKDISKISKTDFHGHSSGITFFDFNKDGLLDIFVSNVGIYTTNERRSFQVNGKTYSYYVGINDSFAGHLKPERGEASVLYQNMGNNIFKNVTQSMGIVEESWSGDAVAMDGNNDGYPDLYLTNMQGNDEYYENDKGNRFIKKSRKLFPKTSWGAMGIAVFDFNNDGQQDIYVTDMHSDMGENAALSLDMEKVKRSVFPAAYLKTNGTSIAGNSFFKKIGKNQYQEISEQINAENYWPWGLSAGDLNADGFTDVFVCKSMNYPFRYTENLILLNENGQRFLDSEYILGIEPRKGSAYAKSWFELDCDGADKDHRDCHKKRGKQTIYGALGTRSSVIFDYDNDGDLDIITNEYNDRPMVLNSNLSKKNELNFLKIKLQGTTSNRDGLGAVVTVKTRNQTYTKVHDGKSGYLAQSSFPLYFGLGEASVIESIDVTWPSGEKDLINTDTIQLNQLNVLTEGE